MGVPESTNSSSGSGTIEESTLTSNDILELFSDDENETVDSDGSKKDEKGKAERAGKEIKDKEDEDGKEEEEEEDKVVDDDEKIKIEDKDDELEFLHVNRREILKAYPDIFKKFPSIEKSIYREQQYAELFPTMQEARESKEAVENYSRFEQTLLNGDITDVLESVKGSDERAFERITETFLPTLSRLDKTAHAVVLSQVLKGAAITMFAEGKNRDNENLQLAAQILHEFAFGNSQITPYQFKNKVDSQEESPKERQLIEREQGFLHQQFDMAIGDVSSKAENVIKSTIDKHIDPKGLMTSYVRSKAAAEILEDVSSKIKSDKSFSSLIDRLWERSMNENFTESSKIKIKNAILAKAQTLLPDAIRKVRAEALKGSSSVRKDEDRSEKPLVKGGPASSNSRSQGNQSGNKSKDGKGMKTTDFFLQD